jgi:uncharacterized protein
LRETVARPWRADPAGLKVLVRVTPKSAREGIEGTVETAQGVALAVRVRAVPQDGDANRAVLHAVAEWLGVARSGVTLLSGPRSRVKTVLVAGEAESLAARLQARLGSAG